MGTVWTRNCFSYPPYTLFHCRSTETARKQEPKVMVKNESIKQIVNPTIDLKNANTFHLAN